jgi:outer membrane protein TolC
MSKELCDRRSALKIHSLISRFGGKRLRNPTAIHTVAFLGHSSKSFNFMFRKTTVRATSAAEDFLWLRRSLTLAFIGLVFSGISNAQERTPLSLPEAIGTGVRNYTGLHAKRNYLNAAEALTRNARNEYLPNVIASVQQSYGTINGQFGPLAAVGALGVASSGPAYTRQSWNAAFGALYIINANWEAFTFGRVKSRVQLSEAQVRRDSADLEQEKFVHSIKIAGAYLNLLIAQELVKNGRSNLARAQAIQGTVRARTLSGLNPGVDSSLANAEVSRARLSLIESINTEQNVQNQLAVLLNTDAGGGFTPDTIFFTKLPAVLTTHRDIRENPQLKFYHARIAQASQLSDVIRKSVLPGLTLFGVYQARASGFANTYTPEDPGSYTGSYADGVSPSRYNYVGGVSLTWNLVSPLKIRQQARAQQYIAAGYRDEYEQLSVQLRNQLVLADQRIESSLLSAQEAPVQYRAASDAYLQKSVLYKNGLTTIVDLQQAMYALNRAEIDRSVASVNVWQALLLKAAASGDFDLFINQAQ